MRRAAVLAVLAWWFIARSGYGVRTVIGPFDTREQCEAVRAKLVRNVDDVPCWEAKR